MVDIADVFRHVAQAGLGAVFFKVFPRNSIGRLVGRNAFPVRLRYVNPYEPNFRRAQRQSAVDDTKMRAARRRGGGPLASRGQREQRGRVDGDGRIVRPLLTRKLSSRATGYPERSCSPERLDTSGSNRPSDAWETACTHLLAEDLEPNAQCMHQNPTRNTNGQGDILPEHVQEQFRVVAHGRDVLHAQRRVVENLRRSQEELKADICTWEGELRSLEDMTSNEERTIRHIRRRLRQAKEGLSRHCIALDTAERRLATGEGRLAEIESTATEALIEALDRRRPEARPLDTVQIQERLFGPELISSTSQADRKADPKLVMSKEAPIGPLAMPAPRGLRPEVPKLRDNEEPNPEEKRKPRGAARVRGSQSENARPAYRSAAAKALQDRFTEIRQQGNNLTTTAAEAREAAVDAYLDARSRFDEHREGYSRARELHLAGRDPGVPDWSPAWTREQFDIAHLAEWMRLSEALREVYDLMRRMIDLASRTGLDPLPDQESDFWQPGSMHYPLSFEQRLIDAAPVADILNWDDGVDLRHDFQHQPNEHPSEDSMTAAYGHQEIVDWPMHDEQVWEPAPELMPGDSASCVPIEYERPRNRRNAGPRPESWTLGTGTSEPRPEDVKQLMSHFH